jgi:hypothetical protein
MTRFLKRNIISRNPNPPSYRESTYKNIGNKVDFEELSNYNFADASAIEQLKSKMEDHKTSTREIVLEMLNDLPSKDVKPPDNTLFVCKLNRLTEEK